MTGSDEGKSPFDWASLVSKLVHPIRVAIIEALDRIDEPLSPSDMTKIFDQQFDLSLVSYHVTCLADFGVIRRTRRRQVRGAVESFYVLVRPKPENGADETPCVNPPPREGG